MLTAIYCRWYTNLGWVHHKTPLQKIWLKLSNPVVYERNLCFMRKSIAGSQTVIKINFTQMFTNTKTNGEPLHNFKSFFPVLSSFPIVVTMCVCAFTAAGMSPPKTFCVDTFQLTARCFQRRPLRTRTCQHVYQECEKENWRRKMWLTRQINPSFVQNPEKKTL